jgi:fused signal recognition particle receptor
MTDTALASPAEAAPVVDAETQAPAAPSEPQSAPESQPSQQAPAQPDWDALLNDDARRRELLKHPALKEELEHRLRSTREADIETRVQQRLAEQQRLREAEEAERKLLEMDSYELGEKVKQERQQTRSRAEIEAQLRQQALTDALAFSGRALYGVAQKAGLSDEQLQKVNPQQYRSLEEWGEALVDTLAELRAEKRLKERLPKEVEAAVQERLGAQRESSEAPVGLPAGGSNDDKAFLDAYGRGEVHDHARARRILNGL